MNRVEHLRTSFLYFNHTASDEAYYYSHRHGEYELVYFFEGTMDRNIEDRRYAIAPRSLLLIPPMAVHSWKVMPNRLCHRFSLHFSREFLDEAEQALLPVVFDPKQPYYEDTSPVMIDTTVRSLRECLNIEGNVQKLALKSWIVALLTQIYQLKEYGTKLPQIMPGDRRIQAILQYLARESPGPVSLDALCHRFGISKNYLNILFRRETGTTVHQYIREQRLHIAHNEIRAGKCAYEAADTAGFNDYSSFFKAYKTLFGTAPTKAPSPGT